MLFWEAFAVEYITKNGLLRMIPRSNPGNNSGKIPPQRKTTLKWKQDGELSAVDMARILDRLKDPKLTECDLSCDIGE